MLFPRDKLSEGEWQTCTQHYDRLVEAVKAYRSWLGGEQTDYSRRAGYASWCLGMGSNVERPTAEATQGVKVDQLTQFTSAMQNPTAENRGDSLRKMLEEMIDAFKIEIAEQDTRFWLEHSNTLPQMVSQLEELKQVIEEGYFEKLIARVLPALKKGYHSAGDDRQSASSGIASDALPSPPNAKSRPPSVVSSASLLSSHSSSPHDNRSDDEAPLISPSRK